MMNEGQDERKSSDKENEAGKNMAGQQKMESRRTTPNSSGQP
jgi:hypothetical protein